MLILSATGLLEIDALCDKYMNIIIWFVMTIFVYLYLILSVV